MSAHLQIYTRDSIIARTRHRHGETKIGERVQTIADPENWEASLTKSNARFVLLGLPEDIGVRANFGRGGAHTAWKPALDFLMNMQSNHFFTGDALLVLGHIDFSDLMEKANGMQFKTEADMAEARRLVAEVDARVMPVITEIIRANKIPVVVGGGHNNAYPLIRSAAAGKNTGSINIINCDPHSDMRPMNGRHSGNGFMYAFAEKYLHKYAVFGLHESYNIASALTLFDANKDRLYYETYDAVFVRESVNYFDALRNCITFCGDAPCGIEIDLDSIQNVPVSARTPSGMQPVDVRKFVWHCAENLDAAYLHIAEGAPVLAHKQMDNKTGKLIAYLITDFIKSVEAKFT